MTTKNIDDEAALIADLNATFPGAMARSLRTWSGDPMFIGAVVCGEAEIEEGYAIGPYSPPADPAYNGCTHSGFEAWCELRGWYVEVHDYGTLFVVPLPSEAQQAEWEIMCAAFVRGQNAGNEIELPF